MATTNVQDTKSRKSTIKHRIFIAENFLIDSVIVAALGFYLGTQYTAHQKASTKAAVQDALKSQPAPAAVAEASK